MRLKLKEFKLMLDSLARDIGKGDEAEIFTFDKDDESLHPYLEVDVISVPKDHEDDQWYVDWKYVGESDLVYKFEEITKDRRLVLLVT